MQKIKSFAFIALFGIAALGLTSSPAKAVVIYSYTGNNFTEITDNNPPAGSYTTSMSVSGSFTLAAPIVPLFSFSNIFSSILSFSFTDGRNILDTTNTDLGIFNVSTDASGSILNWGLLLTTFVSSLTSVGDPHIFIQTNSESFLNSADKANLAICQSLGANGQCQLSPDQDSARLLFDPGTWSIASPPVSVPEPSTLLLFGVGLAGLMVFARRRRQV